MYSFMWDHPLPSWKAHSCCQCYRPRTVYRILKNYPLQLCSFITSVVVQHIHVVTMHNFEYTTHHFGGVNGLFQVVLHRLHVMISHSLDLLHEFRVIERKASNEFEQTNQNSIKIIMSAFCSIIITHDKLQMLIYRQDSRGIDYLM